MKANTTCSIRTLGILVALVVNSAWADSTPKLRIKVVDSVAPEAKYVTLYDYTNPSCEGNRILLESTDSGYRKEMFAMVLSAFHAGTPVSFDFIVSNGQCRGYRVYAHKE